MKKLSASFLGILLTSSTFLSFAQTDHLQPKIHLIYMGGNDCPPCVAWRATELPKLKQSESFKTVKFSFVTKSVPSPVPSSFFLPSEVKPYKEKLDQASSGRGGSPQFAIMVNDEVYDYWSSTRSAEEVVQIIDSIRDTKVKSPFPRCTKRDANRNCAVPG